MEQKALALGRGGEEERSAPVRPSTLVTLTSLTGTLPVSIISLS